MDNEHNQDTDLPSVPADIEPQRVPDNLTESEQVAFSKGWSPDKEAYEQAHPGKKWKSADSFLDAEEMIGSIIELKRELKEQARVAKELVAHNHRLAEQKRQAELSALEARKLEAVEIGDVDEYKKAQAAYVATAQAPLLVPENTTPAISESDKALTRAFVDRNASWCNKNTPENARMTEAADQVYSLLETEFPNRTHAEYLSMTEQKVKALFSHRFENHARSTPAAVSAGTSVAPVRKADHGWKYSDLNSVQKSVCDALVASGKSKDFYLEQLAGIYGKRT